MARNDVMETIFIVSKRHNCGQTSAHLDENGGHVRSVIFSPHLEAGENPRTLVSRMSSAGMIQLRP